MTPSLVALDVLACLTRDRFVLVLHQGMRSKKGHFRFGRGAGEFQLQQVNVLLRVTLDRP